MDEADLLSDRVAILSKGRLHCCGSPLFLKNCFGVGFYLTLVRRMRDLRRRENDCDCTSECSCGCSLCTKYKDETQTLTQHIDRALDGDIDSITGLIHHHVPEAKLIESIGQELTYLLPSKGFKHRAYASLFRELEETLDDMGLSSFGISDTSLEEIFIKVTADGEAAANTQTPAAEANGDAQAKGGSHGAYDDSSAGRGSHQVKGCRLVLKQFHALLVKRFHHAVRCQKDFLAQVVLPASFVLIALVFTTIVPPFGEYPALTLSPWMYGQQFTFFRCPFKPHPPASDEAGVFTRKSEMLCPVRSSMMSPVGSVRRRGGDPPAPRGHSGIMVSLLPSLHWQDGEGFPACHSGLSRMLLTSGETSGYAHVEVLPHGSLGDIDSITGLIHHHVPEAKLIESIGQELTYLLPSKGFKHRAYASLFRELEETLDDMGLSSFGISDTSLEEVGRGGV
ncbi:LOW QUALITY PROTEIN: hypothetical protein CRUP_022596 [Coryphaenoides rupestris]|nr:LOW QUALITY PROTEIN: hypothetical protein CRUP_022596 [Coryphaenoides rupestris]